MSDRLLALQGRCSGEKLQQSNKDAPLGVVQNKSSGKKNLTSFKFVEVNAISQVISDLVLSENKVSMRELRTRSQQS